MDSEQNRSDDYWMGVRDALRMVDSFTKWSRANKGRAKPLEDFLHDGLVAAAKRCESCLHKQLGIAFSSEDAAKEFLETNDEYELPHSDVEEAEAILDEYESESTPPEIVLETEGDESVEEVPIVIESEKEDIDTPIVVDNTVSIDSMGTSDDPLTDEGLVSEQPREFSADFELVEPAPLIITPETDGIETPSSDKDDDIEDIIIEETSDETELSADDEEIDIARLEYAWDSTHEDSSDDGATIEEPPAPAVPEPSEIPEPPKDWSPMDEPSPSTLNEEEESDEMSDQETPPPPPPPETEESEEERRRRARRLFFGA